ncbi:hypothetical protein [Deinococcus malanensis]|uniref:hypothetical protein n=1 Tax=Deinococcus malanensis TaxID=1706855 RepID=UPI001666CE74|nr:hypothetical protein [Deinococcus malanensis]
MTVSGVHDLPELSEVDAVISIADPGDGRPVVVETLGAPVLELTFHDADGDLLDWVPETWHVERVQRFLQQFQPAWLHVHCFAGMSRSTAMASAALACLVPELSDEEVVASILRERPHATPNKLLLEAIDLVLERCLEDAWRREQRY